MAIGNLIGYWPFDKGSGTIAFDKSINSNDGILEGVNPTWVDGISGKAINFPGTDERVDCGNGSPLDDIGNGDFSLSFWMKSKDAVPLLNSRLFDKLVDANNAILLYSSGTNNRLQLGLIKGGNGALGSPFSTSSTPFDTEFNHIVLVINRTSDLALLYVNTIKDTTEIDLSVLPADCSNAARLSWGASASGGAPYEGILDECRIYNRVLTQSDIDFLFNNPGGIIPRFFPVYKQLQPKGRAFLLPFEKDLYKFNKASAKQPDRISDFYVDVRSSGIPTTDMPGDSLTDWESDLGLLPNSALTGTQRQERIIGKYYSVGGQGPDYIQDRFQAAGFPVFVYENNPTAGAREYITLLGDTGIQMGDFQLGDFTDRINPASLGGILYANPPIFQTQKDYLGSMLGDTNVEMDDFLLGEFTATLSIEFEYQIPALSATYIFFWFLAGPGGIFDFVDIPADRQADFESLIFQLKPAHTWVIFQGQFV